MTENTAPQTELTVAALTATTVPVDATRASRHQSALKALADAGQSKCGCSSNCWSGTRNIFAQGHDARLVSRLVDQLVDANLPGGAPFTLDEAVTELRQRGGTPALEIKLRNAAGKAFDRWTKQAESKARREAAKANKPAKGKKAKAQAAQAEVTAPEPQVVTAKIGRWTYEGTVQADGFHYTDKKDRAKVAPEGKYSLV